jgi:steroid delta-isomerase-like uncharacterized protein
MKQRFIPQVVCATLFLLFLSCETQNAKAAEGEKNLALMKRFYSEVCNQGNVDLIDELVAPDLVEHEVFPGLEPNREGLKQFFRYFRSAFPDLHFQVDDIFTAGDKVVARVTIHGTHKGEFMGMAPTGKKISVPAFDILRFAGGKIVEHWGLTDSMTMMQQLGALPSEMEDPSTDDEM